MRDIPPGQLYRSLYARLVIMLPQEINSRVTNMVYLMMGIFLSESVQTGRMASRLPLRVKRLSIVRRLERFLDNPGVRVRAWYSGLACDLLEKASAGGLIQLIMDGSKVSFGHQLLMGRRGVSWARYPSPGRGWSGREVIAQSISNWP